MQALRGKVLAVQFIDRTRPVVLEQPGQRAIRQDAVLGLTARAIVGLILGIADALHRRATDQAWLPKAPVHGHLGAECRNAFGERSPGLGAKLRGRWHLG